MRRILFCMAVSIQWFMHTSATILVDAIVNVQNVCYSNMCAQETLTGDKSIVENRRTLKHGIVYYNYEDTEKVSLIKNIKNELGEVFANNLNYNDKGKTEGFGKAVSSFRQSVTTAIEKELSVCDKLKGYNLHIPIIVLSEGEVKCGRIYSNPSLLDKVTEAEIRRIMEIVEQQSFFHPNIKKDNYIEVTIVLRY